MGQIPILSLATQNRPARYGIQTGGGKVRPLAGLERNHLICLSTARLPAGDGYRTPQAWLMLDVN